MRLSILILSWLIAVNLSAQTKKIAFKSHSGSDEDFKIALKQHLFDMEESNFGLPAKKEIYTKSLDSVISISSSATILVISNYSSQVFPKKEKPILVNVSRDTLYSDPLFSKRHSLDSIRNVLRSRKTYQNPVTKIVFIGFDNKKTKANKTTFVIPVISGNDLQNGSDVNISSGNEDTAKDISIFWMLGLIVGISLFAGLMAWKFAPSGQQSASLQNS